MSQEFHASVVLRLPEAPKEAAEALSILASEWSKFLSLMEALPGATAKFRMVESGAGNGVVRRRRGRPRLQHGVTQAELASAAVS